MNPHLKVSCSSSDLVVIEHVSLESEFFLYFYLFDLLIPISRLGPPHLVVKDCLLVSIHFQVQALIRALFPSSFH